MHSSAKSHATWQLGLARQLGLACLLACFLAAPRGLAQTLVHTVAQPATGVAAGSPTPTAPTKARLVMPAVALPEAPEPLAPSSLTATTLTATLTATAMSPNDAASHESVPDSIPPFGADSTTAAAAHRRALFLSSSASRYSTVIRPGEVRAPFTVAEKFTFALRETVAPEQFFTVTLGAGLSQLENSNPKFGTNSSAYGERVGAAALREASDHLLDDAVFASVFRQDPRYFRDGPLVPFRTRIRHLLISVVTSHSDRNGQNEPDYSGLLGRAATAGMTMEYYPQRSANVRVAGATFGYSLLGELGGNIFLEFWPDILHPRNKAANLDSKK